MSKEQIEGQPNELSRDTRTSTDTEPRMQQGEREVDVPQWNGVQQSLHWLVVLAVTTQLIVGFQFGSLAPDDPQRGVLFPIHAGVGLTILGLMLFRLYWRNTHPVPPLPDTMSPTEKWLAHANHWSFYVLLITMPIVGYFLASASGNPVYFFNAEIPALIDKNQLLQYSLRGLHFAGALVLIMLMSVHVSAAMRHLWVRRDGVMQRMAPFLRR